MHAKIQASRFHNKKRYLGWDDPLKGIRVAGSEKKIQKIYEGVHLNFEFGFPQRQL